MATFLIGILFVSSPNVRLLSILGVILSLSGLAGAVLGYQILAAFLGSG